MFVRKYLLFIYTLHNNVGTNHKNVTCGLHVGDILSLTIRFLHRRNLKKYKASIIIINISKIHTHIIFFYHIYLKKHNIFFSNKKFEYKYLFMMLEFEIYLKLDDNIVRTHAHAIHFVCLTRMQCTKYLT